MINQRRITGLGNHASNFERGNALVAAMRVSKDDKVRLLEAGFDFPLTPGQLVLPSASLGRTALFNAEGREDVHRDQEKETVYRQVEWTHEQWNGPYTETVTEVIERPYERYPRTFVPPPSVELLVRSGPGNQLFITGPRRVLGRDDEMLVHDVNLILDIAQHCEILASEGLAAPMKNLRRLNWTVLPKGNLPWDKLEPHLKPMLAQLSETAEPVVKHRLEIVSAFEHDFVAVGKAGFSGYVIFGFPKRGIFVLECTHLGNATYVFGHDWKRLSQMTKSEILRDDLHLHRLIHQRGWEHELRKIILNRKYNR